MHFLYPALAWGFLLMGVPVLIHLINLLRHRRQKWAAMDFLLESYRRHRRWVWFKQMLLLMSRILIMGLLVALVAQWVSGSRWLAIFGEQTTHHYIVFDDTYSMSDAEGGNSAYQKGIEAIAGILRKGAQSGGSHQVTLFRWSRCLDLTSPEPEDETEFKEGESKGPRIDEAADLLARTVPRDPGSLLEGLMSSRASYLSCSPVGALLRVRSLVERNRLQVAKVYLVSDFRKQDWGQPESVRQHMESLAARGAKIEFVDCGDAQHANLSLIRIAPEDEILAAGVPMMIQVQVKNHGGLVARNVQLRMRALDYGDATRGPVPAQPTSARMSELPTIVIDQIAPGETVTRRVQAVFGGPAWQGIEAQLPEDAVAADNIASCVVQVKSGQKVLLVDGDPGQKNAFFVEAALSPSSSTRTGLQTQRVGPEYLRDATSEDLTTWSAIFLMDIPHLDLQSLDRLRNYVAAGGGLTIVLGESLGPGERDHYNRDWFGGERPLAPIRLTDKIQADPTEGPTEISVESHPIFNALLGLSKSPFQMVRISQGIGMTLVEPPTGEESLPWRVLAKWHGNIPWIGEAYGERGRVLVLLGGLDRQWTNWPQDPTFVVTLLKMVGYLGTFQTQDTSFPIGRAIDVSYSSRDVLPEWQVLYPASLFGPRVVIDINAKPNGNETLHGTVAQLDGVANETTRQAMLTPGIVELWTTTLQGEHQVRNLAYRVSATEGDLAKMDRNALLEAMRPIPVKYRRAEEWESESLGATLSSRTNLLLILLIGVLLLEQFLAWSASYHLPRIATGGKA